MAISSSEFQRQTILSDKTDRIRASFLNIRSHSFLFHLLISVSHAQLHGSKVPLFFTTPFGRPSASLEFLHSLFKRSVQDTTPEGVLSSCWCHERSDQPRSSQEYMACCGCHEILIHRCITVLFLAIFFDLSSTVFEIALFLCFFVRRLSSIVVDPSFKIEELYSKMAIFVEYLKELNSKSNLSLLMELIERSVLITYSYS